VLDGLASGVVELPIEVAPVVEDLRAQSSARRTSRSRQPADRQQHHRSSDCRHTAKIECPIRTAAHPAGPRQLPSAGPQALAAGAAGSRRRRLGGRPVAIAGVSDTAITRRPAAVHRAGSSASADRRPACRRARKRDPIGEPDDRAIGRPRVELTTKIHLAADGSCCPRPFISPPVALATHPLSLARSRGSRRRVPHRGDTSVVDLALMWRSCCGV
jgi:hypothetical protein